MVTDTAFKAPSPMKLSACAADYQGTFGGKLDYIAVRPFPGIFALMLR